MYPASRDVPDKTMFRARLPFIRHTTRGNWETTRTASSRQGWLATTIMPPWLRRSASAEASSSTRPNNRKYPTKKRKSPWISSWPKRRERAPRKTREGIAQTMLASDPRTANTKYPPKKAMVCNTFLNQLWLRMASGSNFIIRVEGQRLRLPKMVFKDKLKESKSASMQVAGQLHFRSAPVP